jgi:hypothetical protein
MQDNDFSFFFEIICCFHPTEYDAVGKDGVYIKEVRKLNSRPTKRAADVTPYCEKHVMYYYGSVCPRCSDEIAHR